MKKGTIVVREHDSNISDWFAKKNPEYGSIGCIFKCTRNEPRGASYDLDESGRHISTECREATSKEIKAFEQGCRNIKDISKNPHEYLYF